MSFFNQIGCVTAVNVRNIPSRLSASLVVVIGVAGVVLVLVSALSMSAGLLKVLANTGKQDRVLILRSGAAGEVNSALRRDVLDAVRQISGIKHDAGGEQILSAEAVSMVSLERFGGGPAANVPFRGVGPQAFTLRPDIKIIAGRKFARGVNEIIVGSAAQSQFKSLQLGNRLAIRGENWQIVGIFKSNGDVHESELMTDCETLLTSQRRETFSSITVQLQSASLLESFKLALTVDRGLAVDAITEYDYYKSQSSNVTALIKVVAYWLTGIMAFGAVFAALNTMYTIVSNRAVEIATLRALGFDPVAIVSSVLIEAMLLALMGGICGAVLSWIVFDGRSAGMFTSVGGIGVGAQVIYHVSVGADAVIGGMLCAFAVGFIGGLFPAVKAGRMPIATALQVT